MTAIKPIAIRRTGPPEGHVEERNEKSEVVWQAADWHRDSHTRRKVSVREIADFLSTLRYCQGADGDVEPSLGESIKIPAQIGLAKFEIDAEVIGNLPPQFNADAGPGAVGIVNIERWTGGEADDVFLFGYDRSGNRRGQVLIGRTQFLSPTKREQHRIAAQSRAEKASFHAERLDAATPTTARLSLPPSA